MVSSQFFIGQSAFAEKKAKPQKVIEAEEFRVLSKDGKVCARLSSSVRGVDYPWPHLAIIDVKGKTRIFLHLAAEYSGHPWPKLEMYGEDGHRLELYELPAGGGHLSFYNSNGAEAVSIWENNSISTIGLQSADASTEASLSALNKGLVNLHLSHPTKLDEKQKSTATAGKDIVWLGVMQFTDGVPTLMLFDKNGITRSALGAIELKHSRTGVVEKRPPSSLVLFGEDGNAIWQAP
jgi:hypothetical protein